MKTQTQKDDFYTLESDDYTLSNLPVPYYEGYASFSFSFCFYDKETGLMEKVFSDDYDEKKSMIEKNPDRYIVIDHEDFVVCDFPINQENWKWGSSDSDEGAWIRNNQFDWDELIELLAQYKLKFDDDFLAKIQKEQKRIDAEIESKIKELDIFHPEIWNSIDHLRAIGYHVSATCEDEYTFFNFEYAKKRAIEHDDWENFRLNWEYLQNFGKLIHRVLIHRMREIDPKYERDW